MFPGGGDPGVESLHRVFHRELDVVEFLLLRSMLDVLVIGEWTATKRAPIFLA